MNELLQKHGCSNVFTIPEGLRELMGDISREVLREQPVNICEFITNYLSALLITREHGVLAVKILDDLCDCRPSVSEHLIQSGMPSEEAKRLSEIINEEIQSIQFVEGKEKVKEAEILKKILRRNPLDEEMTAKVCQISRNAYRDYWYRKKMLEQNLKVQPDEPWEIAAQHTLEIYKKTRPSFSDLTRATQKIQAAYRGYHVRRQMLGHLKPKKKSAPKVDLLGPPIDIAESREIDLGPVVDIKSKVRLDDINKMFTKDLDKSLGLGYDTMKTITLAEPPDEDIEYSDEQAIDSRRPSIRLDPRRPSMGIDPRRPSMGVDPRRPSMGLETRKSSMGVDTRRPSMARSAVGVDQDMYTQEELEAGEITIPDENDEVPRNISFGPTQEIKVFDEVPEFAEASEFAEPSEFTDVPEAMLPEVPEDLPADISEGATDTIDPDPSTAPTASVPSSAPTTAPTSDIEDIVTSGAEEGEEEEE